MAGDEKGVRDPEPIIDPCELRLRPLRERILVLEDAQRSLFETVIAQAKFIAGLHLSDL